MNFTSGLTLAQKTLYYLLYAFLYAMSLLPLRVLYVLSDGLYVIAYYIIRYRRKVVRKNLTISFPEKSESEIVAIEKKFYHWLCDYINETLKLMSMSQKEMGRRMVFHNTDVINKAYNDGHNVALYLGHYCNWEWITSIGLHVPADAVGGQVYHVLENKVVDRLFLKLRSRMHTESIPMESILRKVVKTQREGRRLIIGFISDQVPIPQSAHYKTDFLNHKDTIVFTGTERIAKKCDFACVYIDIRRPRRGYYEADARLLTDAPCDYKDWDITEMYFRELEKTIQRAPQYWLWTHNRWKRSYESIKKWAEENNRKLDF